MCVQLPYINLLFMLDWEHRQDTPGNCSGYTNIQQIMFKLINPWLWFFRFGVLQNKDKAIIAFSISCTKSKPYVEHSYSLPMIAEIVSVMKKSGHI